MFKFGFSDEEEKCSSSESESSQSSTLNWMESKQLFPTQSQWDEVKNLPRYRFDIKECTIDFVSVKDSVNVFGKENAEFFKQAEQLHSDLLPAKYEGGLKIWECTYTLIEHLTKEKVKFDGKKVLDLGCGAGLLGIFALLDGANVTFQDYNAEVIEWVTFPNILANLPGKSMEDLEKRCRFFMGDWASFLDLNLKDIDAEDKKYDFILSSETIYNADNHWKLIHVLKGLLKKSGVAYIAAKTFYFGVGGGLRQFEKLLAEEGNMDMNVCWKCSDGVQREILKVQFKNE
ncbi:histidine protein methyltransferase 1 homolog isoform X2 [Ischnura elegans]|uniref:histidine protein methyltransferase 1 homolog isoform X2 n=1 Tax=Ischnura elegans TaxID=197161 RepID=UPI001ED8B04E|nr:histidine protein methyltransferase 1 homolog isoform X2 [Ischnura elegans]